MDELRKRVSTSALHDTSTRQGDETTECHPNTRQRLLGELMDTSGGREKLVNWLYGPAGAGKTAIMRSLASLFEQHDRFLAGFHFWRSDSSRNTLKNFIATIVFQLAQKEPAAFPLIKKALERDALLLDKSRKTQMEKLIIEPLLACSANDSVQKPRCVVIDGLDECDEAGQREFLEHLLPTLVSRLSSIGIAFFIASRPETTIENLFTHPRLSTVTDRILLEPSPEDVREYLDAEFKEINRCYPSLKEQYGGKWPSDQHRERLVDKSSGYFILCATSIRHINPPNLRGRPPDQRLDDVLDAVSADSLRPLDALYHFILRQNAPESLALLDEWKRALGLVCMPLDISGGPILGMGFRWRVFDDREDTVDLLLLLWYGKDRRSLEHLFSGLGSLIYFDKETRQPKAYHASFADFLFNLHRSREFFVDAGTLHLELACTIIKLLNREDTISHYMMSYLLKENFTYHLDRTPFDRATDISEAFDDITWSSRLFHFATSMNSFMYVLKFLASIYSAFELFLQRYDIPNAPSQRQRMASNISPFVRASLEGVHGFMDTRSFIDGRQLERLIKLWGEISFGGGSDIANPRSASLLPFHSTNCLLRWSSEISASNHAAFSCTQKICLDEQELLNRPDVFHQDHAAIVWSQEDMAAIPDIFSLLKAIGSTGAIGRLLSHFFDNLFPLRCARILYQHLTPLEGGGRGSDSNKDDNHLDLLPKYFWAYTAVYFIHSAALLETLDAVWQMMFLRDAVRSYIDKWHPYCFTWHDSTSPKDAFHVKQILQYLNRCLRNGLSPTVVSNKYDLVLLDHTAWPLRAAEEVLNFSAVQQQHMWTEYSTLVLDDPSFPQVVDIPESQSTTPASDSLPLDVDHLLDSTAFAQQGDSPGLASMPESSGIKRPFNDTEEPEETSTTPQVVKKKKVSFWKALAPGR